MRKDKILSMLEKILYSLVAIFGILEAFVWFLLDNGDYYIAEHPIVFYTGLTTFILVLISGFVVSCIREYLYDPVLLKKTLLRLLFIIVSSFIIVMLLFWPYIVRLYAHKYKLL